MRVRHAVVDLGMLALAYSVVVAGQGQEAQGQETRSATSDSSKTAPHDTSTRRKQPSSTDSIPTSQWGIWDPGKGFTVAKTDLGQINLSGYVLFRYLNQLPASQNNISHLGDTVPIDTRNDIQLQRIMLFTTGWLFRPRLKYSLFVWSVNSTAQVAVGGNLNYTFNKYITLYGGYGGLPGSRSMTGVFPYFTATDRVMTDEFFRPGFTGGVWANGQLIPKVFYAAMIGNNLNQLGVNAAKLNRFLAKSASIWWEPTTGEFGERGGFGDFEGHDKLATRIGASYTWSREDRRSSLDATAPDNTQLLLSDAVPLFQTGSLAPNVTVTLASLNLLALDGAIKYRGLNLYAQGYFRRLDDIDADGPLPLASISDKGFDVQASYMLLSKQLMLFGWTSQLYGAFNRAWDAAGGLNFYPYRERNFRLNAVVIYMHRAAWNGLFGYYIGGLIGPTISVGADIFY